MHCTLGIGSGVGVGCTALDFKTAWALNQRGSEALGPVCAARNGVAARVEQRFLARELVVAGEAACENDLDSSAFSVICGQLASARQTTRTEVQHMRASCTREMIKL